MPSPAACAFAALLSAALAAPAVALAGPAPHRLTARAQAECGALVEDTRATVTLRVSPGPVAGPVSVVPTPGQGVIARCVANVVRADLGAAGSAPRRPTRWTFRLRAAAAARTTASAAVPAPARRIVGVDRTLDPSFKRLADAGQVAVSAVTDDSVARALADALRSRQAPLAACFAEFAPATAPVGAASPGPITVDARWTDGRWDLRLDGLGPDLAGCVQQLGGVLPAPALPTGSAETPAVTLRLAPGAT